MAAGHGAKIRPYFALGIFFLSLSGVFAHNEVDIKLDCLEGWSQKGFGCYWLIPNLMPWDTAERVCGSYGGNLAVPKDFFMNEEMGEIAEKSGIDHFWIGADRQGISSGSHVDLNKDGGEMITISHGHWYEFQPKVSDGECVYMKQNQDDKYKWILGQCERKMASLCARHVCPHDTFTCINGKCVSKLAMCDGEDDCGDGSDEKNCNAKCSYVYKNNGGEIKHPAVGNYSNNQMCSWYIEVPIGSNVELKVDYYDMEQSNDQLIILGGGLTRIESDVIAQFSGSSKTPVTVYSSNNMAIVHFSSDYSVVDSGFKVTYKEVKSGFIPAENLIATDNVKTLYSPFHPIHLGTQDYTFIISAQNKLGPITLEVAELDLAKGSNIIVRDGNDVSDKVLTKMEGSEKGNGFVVNSGAYMHITLKSISGKHTGGFRFRYWQGCDYTMEASHGHILSPGFVASFYPNNVKCTVTVKIPDKKRVSIKTEAFKLLSPDTVKIISNGQSDILTGLTTELKVIENGEFVVEFESSFVGNAEGFDLAFSIDCQQLDMNLAETNIRWKEYSQMNVENAFQTTTLSCKSGASFVQNEHLDKTTITMKCDGTGKWNIRTSPRCERTYCLLPPKVENGYISNVNSGLNFGGTVTYACQTGYSLVGTATISCKLDKSWSAPPQCTTTNCGPSPPIADGTKISVHGDDGKFGSIVQYTCNEGYNLIGSPMLHCTSGGWQGEQPSCKILTCHADTVKHGTLSPASEVNVGGNIFVSCDSGYELTPSGGNNAMKCLPNRTFDRTFTCTNIDECARGTHRCEHNCHDIPGSYTCSCRVGFRKNGLLCEDIKECDPSVKLCDHLCTETEGSYICSCKPGYSLFTANGVEGHFLRPDETGKLKGDKYHLQHSCVPVKCPVPSTIDPAFKNVQLLSNQDKTYHYLDRIEWRCKVGYQSNGKNTVSHTCNSVGEWVVDSVNCTAVSCPVPTPGGLLNPGTVSPNTPTIPFGSSITISCKRLGHIPEDFVRKRTCTLLNGIYQLDGSRSDHECGFVDCGNPPKQSDAKLSDITTTYFGDTLTFGCVSATSKVTGGSTLYKNTTVSCLSSGQWDFGDLSCPAIQCKDPGQPVLGKQKKSDYRDQGLTTFECTKSGYELAPSTPLLCSVSSSGVPSYIGKLPKCIDVEKPKILNCPKDTIKIAAFSSLGRYMPILEFDDNGGVKRVDVSPTWPSDDVYIFSTTQFTFIATDYADTANQESCVVTFQPEDSTKPTFDCPSTKLYTFSGDLPITVDLKKSDLANLRDDVSTYDNIQVTFDASRLTFLPSILDKTAFPHFYDEKVLVSAVDAAGNKATCKFSLHFQADICHPDYLRTPSNSAKTCVRNTFTTGYDCTIKCDDGYKMYNNPNTDTDIISCLKSGSPFPTKSIKCVKIADELEGYYRLSVKYKYKPPSGGDLTGCNYESVAADALRNDDVKLRAGACNNLFTTEIGDDILNIQGNSLELTVSILYQRTPGVSYSPCNVLLEVVLKNPSVYSLSLVDLKPGNCPDMKWESAAVTFSDYYCSHGSEVLRKVGSTGYCLQCPSGTYKASASCEPCDIGYYNELTNQAACTKCDGLKRTYEKGAAAKSECFDLCPPGTYSLNGLPPCSNCPKNTYWMNATYCESCDANKITRQQGSTSTAQCLSKCPAGTFNPADGYGTVGGDCFACPRHQYSSAEGVTSCTKCDADKYTTKVGSKLLTDCISLTTTNPCTVSCVNGQCQNKMEHIMACVCNDGWTGINCNIALDPCKSNPCLNDGVCKSTGDKYTCTCPNNGLYVNGSNCENIIKSCFDDTCEHNGMCENTANGSICHCLTGYSGDRCQEKTDICSSNPCKHGGQCKSYSNVRYSCNCLKGYTGKDCELGVDDCFNHKCANFGECKDGVNGYSCDCTKALGYSGAFCEQRNDPCALKNCGSGYCVPDFITGKYRCICQLGMVNDNGGGMDQPCIPEDFCKNNPCVRGTCDSINKKCNCPNTHTGSLCQHEVNDCESHKCQNNAECIDESGGYSCRCKPGYNGTFCDIRIDHCVLRGCNKIGTKDCENGFGQAICHCNPGYSGSLCSINIEECSSNPCLHDAKCNDLINDYKCDCQKGWDGKNCEIKKDYCTSSTCKNQASCHNVFGDFFCKCLPNTYGPTCDQRTDICSVATPCVRGKCFYAPDGSVQCDCPFGFFGDRCQNRIDYCSDEVCLNGGKCEVMLDDFKCHCKKGFTGKKCDTDIDYCLSANCPSISECIDMEERHYCRCPLQIDGPDCDKAWDQDWDFLFQHASDIGHAYVPYPIQLNSTTFAITMWIQFAENNGKGTVLTLFSVPMRNSLRSKKEFLHLDESKLTLHIGDTNKTMSHPHSYNDGYWHYLVVLVDGKHGIMTIILDTVQSETVNFAADTHFDINFWIILGCQFDIHDDKCNSQGSFKGKLSRVSIYESLLDFVAVTTIGNNDVNTVFTDKKPVLLWNEYVHDRGVTRITPSTADKSCPFGYTNYDKCDKRLPGKHLVHPVQECPKDRFEANSKRVSVLTWTVPSFTGKASVKSSIDSGHAFIWGRYANIIEARNSDGNAALCLFNIYVQDTICIKPDQPPNVVNLYMSAGGEYNRAAINCADDHAVSIPSPDVHTCGPSGDWNPQKPFLPYRISPCGSTTDPINNFGIHLNYQIPSPECDAVISTLEREIHKTIKVLNSNWDSICSDLQCSQIFVKVNCSNESPSKSHLVGMIQLPNINMYLTPRDTPGVKTKVRDVFQNLLLAPTNNVFDYSKFVVQAVPTAHKFKFEQECIAPKVLQQEQCVDCGPGTFHNNDTGRCEFCPIGQYNPDSSQFSCKPCKNGLITEQVGAASDDKCKAKCSKGSYFDAAEDKCMLCKRGFYQHDEGKFFCWPCSADTTTRDEGTVDKASCANVCKPGHQIGVGLNTECEKCPIGYYRSTEPVCQKCPDEFVTPNKGSLFEADCNVANNPPGTRRTGDGKTFENCPIGYYQPLPYQSKCEYCGGNYTTEDEKSVDVSQCRFICPAGKEQVKDKEECEDCPLGKYRDGSKLYAPCDTCSGNYITRKPGAKSDSECTLYRCPAGSAPNENNNGCKLCAKGSYQNEPYQAQCIGCGVGKSTLTLGSKELSDCLTFCQSGMERDANGACKMCERGKYKDNNIDVLGKCTSCPDPTFTTSGPGAKLQSECDVLECPAGMFANYNGSTCENCALGTYQDEVDKPTCKPCDEGKSTRNLGSKKKSDCETYCESGFEKNSTGCTICERGFYKDNGFHKFMNCTPCKGNKVTADKGATSASQCNVPNCQPGTFIDGSVCTDCKVGFYQDEKWQASCKPCGKDKTTQSTGAKSMDECKLTCPAGKENADEGDYCEDCKIGFYKTAVGSSSCLPCQSDLKANNIKISANPGATSSSQCSKLVCIVGYYPSGGVCKKCEYGFYQPIKWKNECERCENGKTTYVKGATSEDQCWSDCKPGFGYVVEDKACRPCKVGYYNDDSNPAKYECTECHNNYITPGEGSKSVTECNIVDCSKPGERRNPDSNTCEDCAKGFYQDTPRQTTCKPCRNGYTTRFPKSGSDADCKIDCGAGQELDASETKCNFCKYGFYRSKDTWTCQKCQSGLTTPGEGSTSSAACSISTCQTGNVFNVNTGNCQPCPLNHYQDIPGMIGSCKICPNGKFTDTVGSKSSSDCKSKCDVTNNCDAAKNETCVNDISKAVGYRCECANDYEKDSNNNCIHKCDGGYCGNKGLCQRTPLKCNCIDDYTGDRCQERPDAESVSAQLNKEILISVVTVGGFLLFLILLIVACCIRMNRKKKMQQSDSSFNDRESIATKSDMPQFGNMKPANSIKAPNSSYSNSTYYNPFGGPDPAVYTA